MCKKNKRKYIKSENLMKLDSARLLDRESAPATYTVPEIAEILRVGRNSAYVLAASGAFRILRFNKSIRIPSTDFWEWFDKHNGNHPNAG